MNMKPLQNIKDTQRLADRVAALNRFVSRSTNKCLPLSRVPQKIHPWNEKCNWAFQDLKKYLSNPSMLKQPNQGDTLYVYLVVSFFTVSTVLVKEEEAIQAPIYYTSRILRDVETRYP